MSFLRSRQLAILQALGIDCAFQLTCRQRPGSRHVLRAATRAARLFQAHHGLLRASGSLAHQRSRGLQCRSRLITRSRVERSGRKRADNFAHSNRVAGSNAAFGDASGHWGRHLYMTSHARYAIRVERDLENAFPQDRAFNFVHVRAQ
jgi:hypothetical protein